MQLPATALLLLLLALAACGGDRGVGPDGTVGPVVGPVGVERALVWFRSRAAGTCELEVVRADDPEDPVRLTAASRRDRDLTVTWTLEGLEPATTYRYVIRGPEGTTSAPATFRTAPAPGTPARVRLALGSCAASHDEPIWLRIREQQPHALVLLGDTPYIDTTDLDAARAKHRAFLALPSLARTLREVPLWSTWDDHDYGVDNGDGTLEGKHDSRRAYADYRPQATYGHDGEGIYSHVRYGPVHVFLLDVRWFAGLERLEPAGDAPSCLGAEQRAWLQAALRESDAPFKLIVSGMVWHDKGSRSQDDWATYAAERDRLFAFLGTHGISGCVLVGGDVHASQHAVFEGTAAGYPLHQLVTSPLKGRAWRGGDRRHPARRWGIVEPHVFLLVDVDTTTPEPTLSATWMNERGLRLHTVRVTASELGAKD